MNHIDEQLGAILAIINGVGGQAWVDPEAPEEIKRAFLQTLLCCPDCRAALSRNPADK
jgi:hypothetical protein